MPVYGWMYVLIGLYLALLWPLLLSLIHPALGVVGAVLNVALIVFTWRRCSSPQLSYWGGMNIIAVSMMSGCANITILYAPLVVLAAYFLSGSYALLGLLPSQPPAAERWFKLVLRWADHDIRTEKRPSSSRLPPPGPGPHGL